MSITYSYHFTWLGVLNFSDFVFLSTLTLCEECLFGLCRQHIVEVELKSYGGHSNYLDDHMRTCGALLGVYILCEEQKNIASGVFLFFFSATVSMAILIMLHSELARSGSRMFKMATCWTKTKPFFWWVKMLIICTNNSWFLDAKLCASTWCVTQEMRGCTFQMSYKLGDRSQRNVSRVDPLHFSANESFPVLTSLFSAFPIFRIR